MVTYSDFSNWLLKELDRLGWSQSTLARRGGLTTAHISRILSGDRGPGTDFCLGVARALKIPPDIVFRKAGILPGKAVENNEKQELDDYWQYLDERDRYIIIAVARGLYERRVEYEVDEDKEER